MFSDLIESGRRRARPIAQAACSLAVHVALGAGAVEATRRIDPAGPERPAIDTTIFVIDRAPPPPPPPSQPDPAAAGPAAAPEPLSHPGAIAIVAPDAMPTVIPRAVAGPPIDPRRFVASVAAAPCALCAGTGADSTAIHTAAAVDAPAEVLTQPEPVYPPSLHAAGLEGRVVLQFVVDTAGRVEPGSIEAVEGDHPAFAASAIAAVSSARFRPARVRGRPVRQLVRQGVKFRIR